MSKSCEIAIVGIGCRLPGGVSNPEEFVRFLRARGDAVREVPPDRWAVDLYYDPDPRAPGKAYVKHGGFLTQNVFEFDPEPFNISPREADRLDPQQRLLLEAAWDALENAGIAVDGLRGAPVAVYIGGFTQDHQNLALSQQNRSLIDAHTSVGASMTVLSNRISYTFDLRGPSLTVDTACSSSLVALHLGAEALANGTANLALVGGVNVMLSPLTTVAMCKGHFLAADGRSKTFDASADGYGRGEGVGIVALKRLADAERDGDRIYAVVRATGVNQDGRTDGMPMPSEHAQRELCAHVLERSGLTSQDIGYVEAHGTGTRAGDPVEARALGTVYGRDRCAALPIGSVKTNIGHLEAAAGITGVIKTALSLYNREIYPVRDFRTPNPDIPFAELNVRVADELIPWPSGDAHAAVNSFGYGGTNAHAILSGFKPSEADRPLTKESPGAASMPALVPVSAACREGLSQRAAELSEAVREDAWRDQAYTLARRRAHLSERAVILASSAEQLASELAAIARGEPSPHHVLGRASNERRLLWVFTGMGPQWWAMGRELYETNAAFRGAADRADRAFRAVAGWSILRAMHADEASSRMSTNEIAQPANFVLQVALVETLRSLGVPEHGILGHSVGEVAAAWASGCLSLEEAAALAYQRSRIQQQVAGLGTMLAVALPEHEIAPLLRADEDVVIAAFNSENSNTLSGCRAGLERIASLLEARGVFNRFVPVEVAYHGPQMEPLRHGFFETLAGLSPRPPVLPLYSTARGSRLEGAVHDAQYWWENARQPVLLRRALELAIEDGYSAFLEVGPHPVLAAAIREVLADRQCDGRTFFALKRREPERLSVCRAAAQLHAQGVSLDWSRLHATGSLTDLPRYPFQRRHHWVESEVSARTRLGRIRPLPFLSERDEGPTPRFTADLARPSLAYLKDHRIEGVCVFPGAGYIEAALSASRELDPDAAEHVIEDLRFERALAVRLEQSPALLVDIRPTDGTILFFGRHSGQEWQQHARARRAPPLRYRPATPIDPRSMQARHSVVLNVPELYPRFQALGLEYGPEFQRLRRVSITPEAPEGRSVLAELDVRGLDESSSCIHPSLLDCAFQALLASTDIGQAMVPVAIDRVRWSARSAAPTWVHGNVRVEGDGSLTANLVLASETGEVLLEVHGLVCRKLSRRTLAAEQPLEQLLYAEDWVALSAPPDADLTGQTWGLVGDAQRFLGNLAAQLSGCGARSKRIEKLDRRNLEQCSRIVFACEQRPTHARGLRATERLLELTRAMAGSACALSVVTFGAQSVVDGDAPEPTQSALSGFARVIMTEHPELACRVLDLPGEGTEDACRAFLATPDLDEEAALRQGVVYGRRLVRAARPSDVPSAPGASALLSTLLPPPVQRRPPEDGEVEVRVSSALVRSSRVRDLLSQRETMARSSRAAVGCHTLVGTVERVGAAVRAVRPGDSVYVRYAGVGATHVLAPEHAVVPVVAGHHSGDAASYGDPLSAWYALTDVARIERGDRVVIDGAGGSLGVSCVQVAHLLGATVFATVDTDEQAAVLAASGVSHVYSAETLDFVDEIQAEIGTEGIQAIVTTASGSGTFRSLTLLAPGGRLVQLEPGESRNPEPLDFARLPSGVSVGTVDLDALMTRSPARYSSLTDEVARALSAGRLQPQSFRSVAPEAAADLVANDSLPRDILIDLENTGSRLNQLEGAAFRADRTYLVTGGLAGFGLATARWLCESGVRSLVLGSRRAVPDAEAASVIESMRLIGARVECRQLDVADSGSVEELLAFVESELPPLGGVFHSAMVLDDRPISALDAESLRRVLLPKAEGAWLLHAKTAHLELTHFVLYSSVSAQVGNPNQASYAAANAFLDGLAALRRSQGRSGLSVSWGAIGDTGVVARNAGTETHLRGLGIQPIPSERALLALRGVLQHSGSWAGIIDMNWDKWMTNFQGVPWTRLAGLSVQGADCDALGSLRAELSALNAEAKRALVLDRTRTAVTAVLQLKADRLDENAPLKGYGLDSLLAVEVQVALERALGVTVPTMELLSGASAADVVARVLRSVAPAETVSVRQAEAATTSPARDLRENFLAHICVQPPYFDLADFQINGEWVEATAFPLPPADSEFDVVACAEAARHLAIVGSCAASLRSPIPGKVYYPVHRADYVDGQGEALDILRRRGGALDRVRVRARCTEFDVKASRARAETELQDEDGAVLLRLDVEYHVISEEQFRRMFADRAEATDEACGANPYAAHQPIPASDERDGVFTTALGPVDPAACLGHFVGYPALPVSIMTRYGIGLIADAVSRSRNQPDARITVLAGSARTESFVFAREAASLKVHFVGSGSEFDEEVWRCEVWGPERRAAVFDFRVRVRAARHSGIHLRGDAVAEPAIKITAAE